MRDRYARRMIFLAPWAWIVIILALFSSCARTPPRPNVVLIVIDTLRADRLGCYGYREIGTPRIDELAGSGIRFENAMSHVPITLPSLATIMTATLPPTTGVHGNEGFRLDDSAVTLAEILKEEGYATMAVVGAVVLDSLNGVSQGFDRYDDHFEAGFTGYQAYVEATRPLVTETQRRADEVTRIGLDMVDTAEKGRPFFLFVHYFDPHTPYDPPPPYSRVDPEIEEDSYAYQLRLYDGEIAYTDEQVGRLIDGLGERGMLENSLVVLTSDHGEGLGEHLEHTHAYFTYESTLHVPLIFSMPGTLSRGRTCEAIAGLVDVVPTVLHLIGIPAQGEHGFQGKSLYPFDTGERTDAYYFECANPFIIFECSAIRGLRVGEWKYLDLPREELYDLSNDPRELSSLVDPMRPLADSLRGEMTRLISELEIYQGGRGREMSLGGARNQDEAYGEKLMALGYVSATVDLNTSYESMFDKSLTDPKDRIDEFNSYLSVRARISIAGFHLSVSEYDECLKILNNLEGIGERQWIVHYYRGLAHIGKNESGKARQELVSAVGSAPVGPERVRIRETLRYLDSMDRGER